MKKLRMGVIGCGDITKYMLYFMKLNSNLQVVGCADIQIEKARKYASLCKGATAFRDYQEMIRTLAPDAVYLAVPHYLHYPIMQVLIENGIHVLCEKPVTTMLEDALAVTASAKAHGVKVGVNYQYRYDKACYRMAAAAWNGDLGDLYYGTCNIPWYRNEQYFHQSKWHASHVHAGGGTLITQGSHALDILLWSFGAKPARAFGVARQVKFTGVEVEDTAMGIVELTNGCVIQITSSMAAYPEQSVAINLYGSKGTAIYRGPNFSRVRFHKARVPRYSLGVGGIHSLGRSLEAFRRWVVLDIPYHTAAEDAIPVLACVLAMYRSTKTQQAEEIVLPEL